MKPRTFTVHLPGAGSNRRADEAREERIETLKGLLAHAIAEGDSQEFRRLHRELKAAVLGRSTAQVAALRRLTPEAT